MTPPTALVAEDEPLLAQALQAELARAWPQLQVVGVASNGLEAVRLALELRPQVLFFDIRMPGQGGLEAAAQLADEWPEDAPFPALVFVTAYDQYAVQAFEAQAMDYVLKPVLPERLARTVARVQQVLASRAAPGESDARSQAIVDQLRHLLADVCAPQEPLTVIQAAVGSTLHMVPIADVLMLEAADKYVRVLTAGHEYLIRTPLKELLPRLDANLFWQVHRGTVVRAAAIASVTRDESGRLRLALRGRDETVAVSRLYAHRFKAM